MADKELKAEIKRAKATNKLMKKVNRYTTQYYGVTSIDAQGGTFFIGNNTFVKTYRLTKTNLSQDEKEQLISFICDKWKGHVRLSIINKELEDKKRIQMIILTVYYMAADYYNAMFDINEFKSLIDADPDVKSLRITENDMKTTLHIMRYICGNTDEISVANTDFIKRSWKNIITDGKEIVAGKVNIELPNEPKNNLKELIQKQLKAFVLAFDINIFGDNEKEIYQKYINKRYGLDPNNKDVCLEFNNLCAVSASLSTDLPEGDILKVLKTINSSGFNTFYDKDNKTAFLNEYTLGIKAKHTMRLCDPEILTHLI